MICKKCKKEIPDNSIYCNLCGKKQEITPRKKAHKRLRGSGTIHKDSRYNKPYIAYAPAAWNGKRKYIGSYATYAEAQQALEAFTRNGRPEMYNATFAQIYDVWSAAHYAQLADNSVIQYKSVWKRFEPLYKARIAELRTPDFQGIIDTATSRSTANLILTLAKLICDYAVENDIITKNYAEFVKMPKYDTTEKIIFSKAQIAALWEHSDDKRVQIILVMIYMGFRIGEICSLTTDNVYLNDGYICTGEKTEAGKDRIIPFPENIPEIKSWVQTWCLAASDNKLFDCSSTYFRNNYFYAPLAELQMIEAVQNPATQNFTFSTPRHLTPHSTRHTFASLSANAGMQPDDLQKIIGHANFQTTADIYIHKDIERLKNEMKKLTK